MAISLKPKNRPAEDVAVEAAVAEVATEAKEKVKRAKKSGRKPESYYTEKYPHAIAGTLEWDEGARKQSMEIKCECGKTRRVFTSDIFQIKTCLECSKGVKAAKRGKVAVKEEADPNAIA